MLFSPYLLSKSDRHFWKLHAKEDGILVEQTASGGHRVIEMKLRQNSIFISEGKGEFMLSRDLREISRTYKASAVVVGTYADGGDRLYVSARMVRPTDSVVISASDFGIPMQQNTMNVVLRNR
jgi:FlgO protein